MFTFVTDLQRIIITETIPRDDSRAAQTDHNLPYQSIDTQTDYAQNW